MRKAIIVLTLPLLASSFFLALNLNKSEPVYTRVGEDFIITLEGNATTGYIWQFARPPDEKMLELLNSDYSVHNPGLAGSGGAYTWKLKALKAGKTTLLLRYTRPWEKNVKPLRKKAVVIIIRKNRY